MTVKIVIRKVLPLYNKMCISHLLCVRRTGSCIPVFSRQRLTINSGAQEVGRVHKFAESKHSLDKTPESAPPRCLILFVFLFVKPVLIIIFLLAALDF